MSTTYILSENLALLEAVRVWLRNHPKVFWVASEYEKIIAGPKDPVLEYKLFFKTLLPTERGTELAREAILVCKQARGEESRP